VTSLKSSDAAADKLEKLAENFTGKTGFHFFCLFCFVCLWSWFLWKVVTRCFDTEVGNTETKTEAAKYFWTSLQSNKH